MKDSKKKDLLRKNICKRGFNLLSPLFYSEDELFNRFFIILLRFKRNTIYNEKTGLTSIHFNPFYFGM